MDRELQKIKDRRETIRNNYLELAQGIWSSEMEIERKDSKVRVEYNKYRNEDRHLERLEQMLNTVIDDFDEYFEDIVGVSFPPEREIKHIVLKFSEHRFPYIVAKPLHGSQKIIDQSQHIVSIDVMPNRELRSILHSFGKDLEVIEPLSLRQAVANEIKKTYEKYFPVQKDCTDNIYLCNVEREKAIDAQLNDSNYKDFSTNADKLHR